MRCHLIFTSFNIASRSIFVGVVAHILCNSLLCLCGVVMYAYFHDCDPLKSGQQGKPDQVRNVSQNTIFIKKKEKGDIIGVREQFFWGGGGLWLLARIFSSAVSAVN